jgi:CBS domain-containing protein
MKVADVMTRGVISIAASDTLRKAAELMLRYDLSGFPVLDHGKLVGIITEGDFLRRAETGTEQNRSRWLELFVAPERLAGEYTRSHARQVAEVMTRNPVTIDEDASLGEAVQLMEKHRIKRLPVVKDEAVVGILSRRNLVHAFVVATPKNPPAPLSDKAIRMQLAAELDRQPWVGHGAVEATVKKGVVVLEGAVRDERQREALRVAAENIPGVTQVVDRLQEIDLVTPT